VTVYCDERVGEMIIAELSVVPIGAGVSVSKYVRVAIKALEGRGVRVIPGPMSTVLECKDIDLLFKAVKLAHRAVLAAGAARVITTLKIDERTDKEATVESKMRAITGSSVPAGLMRPRTE
jgi:uncharacterized protein (TIGR00106 family)